MKQKLGALAPDAPLSAPLVSCAELKLSQRPFHPSYWKGRN